MLGWRIIHITDVHQLSLKLDNLKVVKNDREIKVPLKDIFALVIEDLTCKLTARLMVELSKNQILVLLCNQKYLPECVIQPITGHFGQYRQIMNQLSWQEDDKRYLWEILVRRKVLNQSTVMKGLTLEQSRINKVLKYADDIALDDMTNIEGRVAKIYFNSIFYEGYTRGNPELVENAALNYGYTIFNSAIARTLVAKGLIPSLGIHHKGGKNAYNLASDLIEPFRPIVDYYVIKNPPSQYLTKDYRIELINLLHAKINIRQKMYTVMRAIEICIDSLFDFFETGESQRVCLPNLKQFEFYEP